MAGEHTNIACGWQSQGESGHIAAPADSKPNVALTHDCVLALSLSPIDVHAASPQHDTCTDKAELSLAVDTTLVTTCFQSTSLSGCPTDTVDCSSFDSACATNEFVRGDSLSLATQLTDQFEVCLLRESLDTSFGMQVAAYSGYEDAKPFNGIYVKAVVANSPAERTALINVNDRIVAVNSIDITHLCNEDAMDLLRQQMRQDLSCFIVLDRSRANAVVELLQNTGEQDELAVTCQENKPLATHCEPESSTCSFQLPETVTNSNDSTRSPRTADIAESKMQCLP